MKLQAVQAIAANGEVVKTYHVSKPNKKQAIECAHEKLKFNFPNTYPFLRLKYVGYVNLPEPS